MHGLVFLELYRASENLATIITWVRVAFICFVLLKTVSGEEAFAAKRTLKFLLVHLVVFFLLAYRAKHRGAALTFVHFGGWVEINWHKHASCTLFAHAASLMGRGRGGSCRTGSQMD